MYVTYHLNVDEFDDENRLIYTADEKQNLCIISCKGHYK